MEYLVQDEDFRCFMVDAIFAAQPDNGATFKDLAKNSSTFKTALNAELRQSIIDNSVYPKSEAGISLLYANTAWDANSYLYERFVYDSVQYEPSIYFIGEPSSCELTDTIGVVIGEEVTCCDDAPGWLNGVETLFSEYYSINSPNINIFIGPNEIPEEESLMNPGNHIVQNDKVNQRKTIVDIDVDEWKIKNGYRYESSCESEIRAQVIMYNVLANWDILGQKFDGFPKKVSSINVGTSTNFTTDVDAYGMDVDRYDSGYRAFTYAYEYDWYVYNYKVIKNPIVDALYLNGKGRMKYSNEWYFRDNQILKYMLPSVNSTAIIENDKCRFKMKRSL